MVKFFDCRSYIDGALQASKCQGLTPFYIEIIFIFSDIFNMQYFNIFCAPKTCHFAATANDIYCIALFNMNDFDQFIQLNGPCV